MKKLLLIVLFCCLAGDAFAWARLGSFTAGTPCPVNGDAAFTDQSPYIMTCTSGVWTNYSYAGMTGAISTGQVAFGSASNTIAGDNGLYWDNTNKRLGIGTTSPSANLQINADRTTDAIILRDTVGSANARFYFTAPLGGPPDLNISAGRVIFSGGRVLTNIVSGISGGGGLSLSDSSNTLLINAGPGDSSYSGTGSFDFSPSGGGGTRPAVLRNSYVSDGATSIGFVLKTVNSLTTAGATLLKIDNAATNLMTVLANGNVGIGTTSPTYKLEIRGNGSNFLQLWDGSNGSAFDRFGVSKVGAAAVGWSFSNFPSYSFDNLITLGGTTTLNSGTYIAQNIYPTINQTATAGYSALRISPYEQGTGSGSKYLIDAGTNSAANGGGTHTRKFTVDNSGNVSSGNLIATNASGYAQVSANNLGFLAGSGGNFIYGNGSIYMRPGSAGSSSTFGIIDGGVAIGYAATLTPAASAALDIQSTTKGFLPPRMTSAQASAISSPAEGLMVYVTDTNGTFTAKGWWGYDGAAWQKLNN